MDRGTETLNTFSCILMLTIFSIFSWRFTQMPPSFHLSINFSFNKLYFTVMWFLINASKCCILQYCCETGLFPWWFHCTEMSWQTWWIKKAAHTFMNKPHLFMKWKSCEPASCSVSFMELTLVSLSLIFLWNWKSTSCFAKSFSHFH